MPSADGRPSVAAHSAFALVKHAAHSELTTATRTTPSATPLRSWASWAAITP